MNSSRWLVAAVLVLAPAVGACGGKSPPTPPTPPAAPTARPDAVEAIVGEWAADTIAMNVRFLPDGTAQTLTAGHDEHAEACSAQGGFFAEQVAECAKESWRKTAQTYLWNTGTLEVDVDATGAIGSCWCASYEFELRVTGDRMVLVHHAGDVPLHRISPGP